MKSTLRQPPSVDGLTHASRVNPLVRCSDTESFTFTNAFSFRRGETWNRGTFWNVGGYSGYAGRLANGSAVPFNGKVYHDAFKGVYNLSLDPNDKDILLVRVAFTKRYVVKNTGDGEPKELEWALVIMTI